MSSETPSRRAAWWSHRAVPWVLLGITLLMVLTVRVRLRDTPLERDEGEYAYAGQLILQGVPPYLEASNMKLPGTYVAYALIMAVFGETPAGIRLGLTLVNLATITLIFLLGRRLLDDVAGVVAAVAYALLSLSPSVLGLAAHATHFVALPAVAGILCLLTALSNGRYVWLFASGLLFGLAFLMKQHGVFFGVCGFAYLLWVYFGHHLVPPPRELRRSRRDPAPSFSLNPPSSTPPGPAISLALYLAGCALPYLLTCLVLAAAGVFPQFWFWTMTYAREYAAAVPWIQGQEMMRITGQAVFGAYSVFWALTCIGVIAMWWEERLDRHRRALLTGLLLCSLAAVGVGFYFRQHYFILLLPVAALLAGVAVSRGVHLLRRDQSIELFLALAVVLLFPVALAVSLIGDGSVWFGTRRADAERRIYGYDLFSVSATAAAEVRNRSQPETRIAVLGSEPQIYFLARRRSVTEHIYMYPLMEHHPHAARLQEDLIRGIEEHQPAFVVYVDHRYSWLVQPGSERKLLDWWPAYWAEHYDLIRTYPVRDGAEAGQTTVGGHLLVLQRKAERN